METYCYLAPQSLQQSRDDAWSAQPGRTQSPGPSRPESTQLRPLDARPGGLPLLSTASFILLQDQGRRDLAWPSQGASSPPDLIAFFQGLCF